MTQNEMIVAIYGDMQELKTDVRELKDKVQVLEGDVRGLKDDVRGLKDDVQDLKDDVQVLKDDVQVLKADVQNLKGDVRGLHLTLENVTNKNIQVVAEGHLDLSRKLDDALKVETEKEMMHLRVNVLENDMRKVKEKIGIA